MSRRRGEFEHRTSIFEGAFRAWSHLGGLDPTDLENKTAAELDPLTNPLEEDLRLLNGKGVKGNSAENKEAAGGSGDDGGGNGVNEEGQDGGSNSAATPGVFSGKRREYPYEPLPRSGLSHPFVQAILSPWLGPDADQDAIQLGLTTLRTWWQHRRKGESGSAVAALGTDKMRGVVEGYTRHFFNLAHCLVTNDKEQPPRTLNNKMREVEKLRTKRNKKRAREEEAGKLAALALNVGLSHGLGTQLGAQFGAAPPAGEDPNLTPLERLHAAQRRQLAESGGIHSSLPGAGGLNQGLPPISEPTIPIKGKCIPGKVNLPSVVNQISSQASQLAHRGGGVSGSPGGAIGAGGLGSGVGNSQNSAPYGDPSTTPVVLVSGTGDIQISMSVEGITCAHCVKIVETVLRGCNGNKSPINGLLDAAADRVLNQVLIKIDQSSNAKRIAFESARNLAMVGYTAKAKEMSIESFKVNDYGRNNVDLSSLTAAFEVVGATDPRDVFDWHIPCACPDNGVLREDCPRHSQMNTRIFEAFDERKEQVEEYIIGCGKKYGKECTCGPDCSCKGCNVSNCRHKREASQAAGMSQNVHIAQNVMSQNVQAHHDSSGGGFQPGGVAAAIYSQHQQQQQQQQQQQDVLGSMAAVPGVMTNSRGELIQSGRQSGRNSLGSWGNSGFPQRGMSITSTSDVTFGRAMSGLSALSIDWENMEDFDVNVDHSAHINNGPMGGNTPGKHGGIVVDKEAAEGIMAGCNMLTGGDCNCGPTCVCIGCPVSVLLFECHFFLLAHPLFLQKDSFVILSYELHL